MLTLVNTNRMTPAIGPIGLDYIGASARRAGIEVEVLDLGLVEVPDKTMEDYFDGNNPELVGLSFRNSDDCFWPSADWFAPAVTLDRSPSATVSLRRTIVWRPGRTEHATKTSRSSPPSPWTSIQSVPEESPAPRQNMN